MTLDFDTWHVLCVTKAEASSHLTDSPIHFESATSSDTNASDSLASAGNLPIRHHVPCNLCQTLVPSLSLAYLLRHLLYLTTQRVTSHEA